uniref:Ribosomal protein L14 n=1 Tax=Symbiochloris sp. SG-2018 TaxID=2126034 RepID=A0A976U620_9CHLO|nr:ribosomal protein L14 [Symbiochloris sp. SG-2018]UVF37872.1 ribosomal protein L14 [Symbiochloris sp. SG-2018]
MIIKGSKIKILDNSGGKVIQIINPYKISVLGEKVQGTIKKVKKRKRVTAGTLCAAVLTQTKQKFLRLDNSSIKFDINSCVLINNKSVPIASKITGFGTYELKINKFNKIILSTRYNF